jgi:hypothetical protein
MTMKTVGLVAGIVLLIAAGLASYPAISVFVGVLSHNPAVDTNARIGAGIFLFMALFVGGLGDLLLALALSQPRVRRLSRP